MRKQLDNKTYHKAIGIYAIRHQKLQSKILIGYQ